jgi:ribosomal RNA-processing protein 36
MGKSRHNPPVERDDDASDPYSDELNVSSPEVIDTGADGDATIWDDSESGQEAGEGEGETEEEAEEAEEDQVESSSDSEARIQRKLSTVSFGALAKAQQAVVSSRGQKRKRDPDGETEAKLQALRQRLKELSQEKPSKAKSPSARIRDTPYKARSNGQQAVNNDFSGSQSDSEASLPEDAGHRRSSKHAPAEQSSRKAVSRRRDVVHVPKPKVRDPRFDPTTGSFDREQVRKNYGFLDDYVDTEIKQIKSTLKEQKSLADGSKKKKRNTPKLPAEELEGLKRDLVQKESRRAAQVAHDRERDVMRDHRAQEKQRVKEGKKPFFLKRSEIKKQVLVKRFEGMGEGKRERVMEKKRRRVTAKERRSMPQARRT